MVSQFITQLKAVGVAVVWSAVASPSSSTMIKWIGLKASPEAEEEGLDISNTANAPTTAKGGSIVGAGDRRRQMSEGETGVRKRAPVFRAKLDRHNRKLH
jgi:hypothetical protein